jgi:hypothetical protein
VRNHRLDKWEKGKMYYICENGMCFLTVEEYGNGLR